MLKHVLENLLLRSNWFLGRSLSCNLQRFELSFLQLATSFALDSFQKANHFTVMFLALRLRCDLAHDSISRSNHMADVIFILITVVFFLIACWYVYGCDRL